MLNRFAMLAAVCVALPVVAAPLALADPPPPPDPAVVPVNATNPLPPEGAVPSAPPGVLDTPDGWHLEVSGANETQLPVAPLTTAISSREYLIAGTFTGKITGGGKTKLTRRRSTPVRTSLRASARSAFPASPQASACRARFT
jgi:hypothetical protein